MSDLNKGRLNYSETTYFRQLRIAGISTIFNWSIVWAIVFTSALIVITSQLGSIKNDFITLSKHLDTTFIATSTGALGVIIAALSVTIALFSKSLLPMLLKSQLLHKFLFPFWYSVALWGISAIVSVLLSFLNELQAHDILVIVFGFEIFIFTYAVFFTINLTGQIIRLALQNAQNIA